MIARFMSFYEPGVTGVEEDVGARVLEEDGAVDLRGLHGRGRRWWRGRRRMATRAEGHGGRAGRGGRRRVSAA